MSSQESDSAGPFNTDTPNEVMKNGNRSKKYKSCYDENTDRYKHLEQRFAYVFDLAKSSYSKEDSKRLENLLKDFLKFYVIIDDSVQNLEDINNKLVNVASNSKRHEDSVLVVLLYDDTLNNENKLMDVWKHFMDCDRLGTKPKMFLFVEYHNPNKVDTDNGNKREQLLHIPSHSDFLLVHGFGEKYVGVLCEVVRQYAEEDEDFVSMLTYTHSRLQQVARDNNVQEEGATSLPQKTTKIPFFNNLLTHDVIFKLAQNDDVTDHQQGTDYTEVVTERRGLMNETPKDIAEKTLKRIQTCYVYLNEEQKVYVDVSKEKIQYLLNNPPIDQAKLQVHIETVHLHTKKYN